MKNGEILPSDSDINKDIKRNEMVKIKNKVKKTLTKLTVKVDGNEFDANQFGIVNLSSVGTLANYEFNRQMVININKLKGMSDTMDKFIETLEAIYVGVYKDTPISWKCADNKFREVSAETVLSALEKSMVKTATLIGVDSDEELESVLND